jgi:hypothetical protein
MQKAPLKFLNTPQMSKPIPAKTLNNWKTASTNQVHAEHDLLVWYEICELESNGE